MQRLLKSKSIAVIGGGAWCEAVIAQNLKIGFAGEIWPVHPTREAVGGLVAYRNVSDLPGVPDATFIGVNRMATVEIVSELAAMGAGGAVCFASGFAEAEDGRDLSASLLAAAGEMPILGPNCYGALNALDRVALWPDQHGLRPVERGVAIVAQSSNIAINLTMQQRGLPIAYVVTAGNQLQLGLAEIGLGLLEDPRVTALGLYIESFGDIRAFEALAARAYELGKRIVALKVGRSAEAQVATISHTASLAGSAAGSDALMARLGIANAPSLSALLETLKLFHCFGGLDGTRIASLSCSGGEASVMADAGGRHGLSFPALNEGQKIALGEHLSGLVSFVNPLDYHTDIWRDRPAMAAVFAQMARDDIDLVVVILDFPRPDLCDLEDWMITVEAIEDAALATGRPFGVLASSVENLPEDIAMRLIAKGIVPLCDFDHGIEAVALSVVGPPVEMPVFPAGAFGETVTLSEAEAKEELSVFGVNTPVGRAGLKVDDLEAAAQQLAFPLVLKGEGVAHKSDAGLVALGLLNAAEVVEAARQMDCESFALDEMISDAVAELLIGVVRDPAHGFVLTLGAGGVLTEVLEDRCSLLVPASQDAIKMALDSLKSAAFLDGYRGMPAADREAVLAAIQALQAYVVEHGSDLVEVEINPLLCTPTRAVAVDALIVKEQA